MINSTYDPLKVIDFEKSKITFDGKSVLGSAVASETKNFDLLLADDYLITGGVLKVKGAKFFDLATLQIVHPTYGVVNQFVTDYCMNEDTQLQLHLEIPYPAKLIAGLLIRLVYKATADAGTRSIALNYQLHKVLV